MAIAIPRREFGIDRNGNVIDTYITTGLKDMYTVYFMLMLGDMLDLMVLVYMGVSPDPSFGCSFAGLISSLFVLLDHSPLSNLPSSLSTSTPSA